MVGLANLATLAKWKKTCLLEHRRSPKASGSEPFAVHHRCSAAGASLQQSAMSSQYTVLLELHTYTSAAAGRTCGYICGRVMTPFLRTAWDPSAAQPPFWSEGLRGLGEVDSGAFFFGKRLFQTFKKMDCSSHSNGIDQ